MMKRLRAPEHQTATAAAPATANPAPSTQENPQSPPEASVAPLTTAESKAPAAEIPSTHPEPVTDTPEPPADPVPQIPIAEQLDPTSRCNGEASAGPATDTGEEPSG